MLRGLIYILSTTELATNDIYALASTMGALHSGNLIPIYKKS